jgi:V/A-type H+-transporting ATPase subunit A
MGYKVAIMPTRHRVGQRRFAKCRHALKKCLAKKAIPPIYRFAWLNSMKELVMSLASEIKNREGAVTAIGAVSPPGGDTSEPVSQATLRIVKVFWGLSAQLAYRRHFPAIDWIKSYSLYEDVLHLDIDSHYHKDWSKMIRRVQILLQEEASLQEIVRLVGIDSLSKQDRIKLLAAQMIREDFLHQNAYHEIDTYASIDKQYAMLKTILSWYDAANKALQSRKAFSEIEKMKAPERIGRIKYVREADVNNECNSIQQAMEKEFSSLGEE